jgi:hypothetical protein
MTITILIRTLKRIKATRTMMTATKLITATKLSKIDFLFT